MIEQSCSLCTPDFLIHFFFFNDTPTTEIYTLSLHDALPISGNHPGRPGNRPVEQTGGTEGGVLTLKDLAVLTPPLLVCVAFLIAVGAFLRHEMAAKRRQRDNDVSADISDDGRITERADRHRSVQSERG